MRPNEQDEVVAFLSTAAAYGRPSAAIERIDTHISIVWLVGDRAFKLKRAVRFDYVDFSTAALRHAACEAEVRLNRRAAPALYLGVRAVTREHDGTLAIEGRGAPIDWLVEMVRFDQETLFDRLAERGRLDVGLMPRLAAAILRLHAGARVRSDCGGRAGMTWVADGNALGFRQQGNGVLDPAACRRLHAETCAAIERHASRLDDRRRGALVRECHGDLHLRNICLVDGAPTIFDAVEFNDNISCIDVLYDVAFLLMDLWRRGLQAHANAVLNAYLAPIGHVDALCLLPLFLSCRAAVRAKTSVSAAAVQADAARRADLEAGARQYLELAGALLHPPPARLIAIGGFSGSGKTTLARGLAPGIGAAPGALVVRSDVIRKVLFGADPDTRLEADSYTLGTARRVYETVDDRALDALAAGHAVVADAVFAQPDDRADIAAIAREAGVPFVGLWIDGPREVLARRIAGRERDASDATGEVLDRQLRAGAGAVDWHHLDGSADADTVLQRARSLLS